MSGAVIIGGGVSGLGAAKLLAKKYSNRLAVVDQREIDAKLATEFSKLGCKIQAPCATLDALDQADLVIFSPTVTLDNALLRNAMARGIPCLSEVDLGVSHFTGPILGVTGTNGKSTVTSMVEHILLQQKVHAKACGNIGVSVCEAVSLSDMPNVLVIELSSYQLELSRNLRPVASVFSSFSFDHLERHKTLKNYFASKWKLLQSTVSNGIVVMTADVARAADKLGFSGISCNSLVIDDVSSKGIWQESLNSSGIDSLETMMRHDKMNALMAATVVSHFLKTPRSESIAALRNFKPLPHRCQIIGKILGHLVINDSKSTNVESTLVALNSTEDSVVLFLGGKGKGESYKPIGTFSKKIKQIIAFGASGREISDDLCSINLPVTTFATLSDALMNFTSMPVRDAAVLFSPACASFDEFRNFEHRGEFFSERMRGLLDGK